ncbi:hypothetical protein KBD45_05130 [Candidatus Dojkabacteria bacterium]|nr:hypothetical protein [Candidatus Dojkabacteria bacterium]
MIKTFLAENKQKVFNLFLLTTTFFIFFTPNTFAECGGNWIPEVIQTYICNPNPELVAESRIRALFFIAIGVIILTAIVMTLRMGLKLIMSGGKEEKEREAFDGIKAIFVGIILLFVILLAIPIVLGFFGVKFNDMTSGMLICVKAPQSAGCYACMNKNLSNDGISNSDLCSICEKNSSSIINSPARSDGTSAGTINCTDKF